MESQKLRDRAGLLIEWAGMQIDYNSVIKEIIYKVMMDKPKQACILKFGTKSALGIQNWFKNYNKVIEEYCSHNIEEFENPYMVLYTNMFLLGIKDFQDLLDTLIFPLTKKDLKDSSLTSPKIIEFLLSEKNPDNYDHYLSALAQKKPNPLNDTTTQDLDYKPITLGSNPNTDPYNNPAFIMTGNIHIDEDKGMD